MVNKLMEEYQGASRWRALRSLAGPMMLGLPFVLILLAFIFAPDVIDPQVFTGQVEGRVLVVKRPDAGGQPTAVVKLADGSYYSAPTDRYKEGEVITLTIYTRRFSRRQVYKIPH